MYLKMQEMKRNGFIFLYERTESGERVAAGV